VGKQAPSEATACHSQLQLGRERLWLEVGSTDPAAGWPDLAKATGDDTGGEGAGA
jgi:hypothetical protein